MADAKITRAYFIGPSYINHQLHITLYNFFKFLHVWWWTSLVSFHVLHLHLSFKLVGTTKMYSLQTLLLSLNPIFYAVAIQIGIIQLLIFIEKFSPLLGFEPSTYPVPSQYATNWAILAWIIKTVKPTVTKGTVVKPCSTIPNIFHILLFGKNASF